MSEATPYISLALDVITETVLLTGVAASLEDCKEHAARTESPYQRTFPLDDDFGPAVHQWLRDCGVPTSQANEIIRALGREILKLMPAAS